MNKKKNKTADGRHPSGLLQQMKCLSLLLLLMLTMSGCLYPSQSNSDPKTAYRESVNRIQSAIEAFQKDEGILPILNADADTPKYEKFRVDLSKLKQLGYLDDIPGTAFENGGSAYFLIQNEEVKPTVKVMDLQTVQKVNDVQRMVDQYKSVHNQQLPAGEKLYPGFHAVDMNLAAQPGSPLITLKSVYSGQELPFMMNEQGTVYVDYAFDIMQALEKTDGSSDDEHAVSDDPDLRNHLLIHSYFVPVKSVPYTLENNTPVAQIVQNQSK
ncbi:hypothetical protein SAMN05720606_103371 [Paenibacillus polysaccharolyticus]|uniref:Uncharacterized protein n=1 Tax=Paenibacillus polysaccharolyticus TaxID=582692 RepID=A0A1G5EPI1_9BACL|nr:hypothetical protein [Paenibacillus polysaccharolyticus]SCY28671.1 hypothetical protein SAMN05720606_103371 [Paenibacillus polysaccharolyticus]